MKHSTIAAALLPLASAVNVNTRQASDVQFLIDDFETVWFENEGTHHVAYQFDIKASDNLDFTNGCFIHGTSVDPTKLPAVPETKCGIYTAAMSKSDDGGLVLYVRLDGKRLEGTHAIPASDLKIDTEDGVKVQEFDGEDEFRIDATSGRDGRPGAAPVSSSAVPSASGSASASSAAPSGTPTPTPSASGTETGTGSSASASGTSGAGRAGVFAGVPVAVGVVAMML